MIFSPFTWDATMRRRSIHVVLLLVITSIVFSNTLENAYHLDSVSRVENNPEVNELSDPVRFFTDRRTGSVNPRIAEYRPMMPLSHAINNEISAAIGIDKLAGLHVGNIAIHAGSALLLYFLFCLLIVNWGATEQSASQSAHYSDKAFAAALVFSVHPIAGSAVNYIAGRDLLLMVFFFLASVLVYCRMRRTGDSVFGWFVSLFLLSLAILSKQSAIIGFGLVFLFEWVLISARLKDWRLWARTILFGLPTVGYFLLRWLWITKQNPGDGLRTVKGFTYPLTMLDTHLFYYLRNFVWPFEMRALAKVEMIESVFAPTALVGLLFIVATLLAAWLLRKRQPLITFAILGYWLLFSLTSSIFPFQYVVTDYRQYLPFAFLCLISSLACFSLRQRTVSVVLLAGSTLYFAVSSYQINKHWKTEESFWYQSVKYGAVALAHNNYGLVISSKNPDLAEEHYLEALRQSPFHGYAGLNLGLLNISQGKEDEGLERLHDVVALNPDWALTHYWLSIGLQRTGRKEEALEPMKRAADLDPRRAKYQYEAARAFQSAGKLGEAVAYFERAVKLSRDYRRAEFWLGFAYQESGRSQDAVDTYNRFLERNPDHVQGHFNLAYELIADNQHQAAIDHFERVLDLQPGYREAHLHLSRCYRALGNEELATHHATAYQPKSD